MKSLIFTLAFCLPLAAIGQVVDADADGVDDAVDVCLGTPPADLAGAVRHKHNRYILANEEDLELTTGEHPGKGKNKKQRDPIPLAATGGCSCDQIITALELGKGHIKFGCSQGAINDWIEAINEEQPE